MNSNNQTGLHLAAQAGLLPALRLLLDAGAQVNQVDSVGKTCLELANNTGNHSCRKLLLLWGAAPAKLERSQRASSLPNLAAEITEDQSEANAEVLSGEEEEETTRNKAEDKAGCVKERLEVDQELCERVKEMQTELSELRKDVTRLRRERSEADETREEDENGSLIEQLDQVGLVERTNKRGMARSRSNEFLEGLRYATEGHNHPEGKESKNVSTEIDSDLETPEEEKSLPVGMKNEIPPQTQESETQCNLGAETSKSQNPGFDVTATPQDQHQQPSNQGGTEDLSLPRLPGVGRSLVQIPPLVLPPCTSHPNPTPPTRHSSTQCSLVVTNTAEEDGASISSRDQHQHFVAADISRRKKQHLGSEVEEGDDLASHHKRPGTSRIVYDREDQRSWDGEESPVEGEERFQYSSDEEVPYRQHFRFSICFVLTEFHKY